MSNMCRMSGADTYHGLCQSSSDDEDNSELITRHRGVASRSNTMQMENIEFISPVDQHELELEDSCTDEHPLLSSNNGVYQFMSLCNLFVKTTRMNFTAE